MPIPLLVPALISAGSSMLSGIGRGMQEARAAKQQEYQQALQNAQMQRQAQNEAQAARLGFLTGAQGQEASLAAQRLAAMGLGTVQDFEQLQARRGGLSEAARNWQAPRGMSPAASAFAAQTPNLLAPIFGTDRYRQATSEGRTQASIADYMQRVNELRRNPNLDAEQRAALDRMEQLANQALPQAPTSGRGNFFTNVLLPGLAAGAGAGANMYMMGQMLGPQASPTQRAIMGTSPSRFTAPGINSPWPT